VALNTAAVEEPDLIDRLADRFGAQCVVVSIDARRASGAWEAFTRCGTRPTGRTPAEIAADAARRGAGEILITSIERDGTMAGYDVELTRSVVEAVDVPVIASGGAGTYEHMAEVLRGSGCAAVAAASIFHFSEQTPLEAKRYLGAQGFPVRLSAAKESHERTIV
jgi:cyclase